MISHKTRATAAALSMPLMLGLAAAPALATETVPNTTDTTASSTVTAKGKEKRSARAKAPSRSRAPYKFGTKKYNQWYAKQYMQYKYGWGKKQRRSLVNLWNRESGWSQHAHNSSSGAHGIPQALPVRDVATA